MHRSSWLIYPLTTALLFMEECCPAQAQNQGISGVCSVPISVQSLPFETTTATILKQSTPAVETSLCDFDATDQGHAYIVTGTDKMMQVLATWKSTNSGTLGLFTGDCDPAVVMTCIADQYLSSWSPKGLLWEGRAGVKYTIVVAGNAFYVPSIGYSLKITENEGPLNDSCDSAVAVSSLPFSAVGDTRGALSDFDVRTCYVSPTVRGVWYKLVGNDRIVQVRVTNASFSLQIVPFKGSCADLFCHEKTKSGSGEVNFLGDAGVEYSVLVTGYSNALQAGTFSIDVAELDLPPNYNCDSAMQISSVPFSVTGDTTGAISGHYDPSCGGQTDTTGIWYKVIGQDKVITLIVSGASFDFMAGAFTGECDNLQVVKCWTPSLWLDRLVWHGLAGVQYTIVVMGENLPFHVGTFDLEVYDTERPSNDDCSSAEVVESLPFFGNYDTRGANVETVVTLPFSPTARGVWFTFVGGGGMIEMSISSLTFDFDLRIYGGSCGNLTLISNGATRRTSMSALFTTTTDEQYFVLATGEHGFDDVGTFGIEITGAQVLPPNINDIPPTESPTDPPNFAPTEDPSIASPPIQDLPTTSPPATLPPTRDSEAPSTRSLGAVLISLLAALLFLVN